MTKKINAIILAAGRGRRLTKISYPKCLIRINQKQLLENLINNFKSLKINNINIVVGYKKDKIIKKFQNQNFIRYSSYYIHIMTNKYVTKRIFVLKIF